jgi:shikimate kinase
MNFYLIGMMASGKSYFGKTWAEKNLLSFTDLDEIIVTEYGAPIAEIFETEGESFFREMEKIVLQQTEGIDNTIIACGGGTACFHNNMDWMNDRGVTIWLNPSLEDILENLKNDQATRPLLMNMDADELKENLIKHLSHRSSFYEKATYEITNFDDADNLFQLILHRHA